ncbi:urea ABC transporter permease subunit UrtB [Rhodovarius crocodyli]|uniref:urea ABC transporter permease subunit UrtB n=1 Tax=Rhodovarius crocodyli TaxID=1979269 RepID=UPI00197DDAF6|nr:urea ABC transporter permease subunit UrtB [Rhodovarius crocodyli]
MIARLLAVLLFCALAASARAQTSFEELVPRLGGGFGPAAEAAQALGTQGDPRALPILRALSEGRLLRNAEGRVILDGRDAATGEAIAAEGATRINLNNRLRVVLRGAIGRLALSSPNAAERRAAADAVFRTRSAENVPLLEDALSREAIPEIRALMELALGASRLLVDDVTVQRAGIIVLSGAGTAEARSLLLEARAAKPELAVDIDAGIATIDRRLAIRRGFETAFQGISLGSVLLLAALGLAITFGVMGVINMAHGEMVMIGAYTTFMVQEALRHTAWAAWSLPLSVPAAFLVTAAVGVVLERFLIRHLYGRPLETLLLTFGIGMMLQQGVRLIFGAQNREVLSPAWMQGTLMLPGGLPVTQNRLWIILFGLAVLALTMAAIRFTRFGLEMRAVVQNRRIAATMGIRTGWVDAMTFAFGSGLAGLAGVALSQIDNVSPNLGTGYIIDSFMVVVFGGVGSLVGTLVGALTLGIVNKLLEPYAGAVLAKVAVLVGIMLFIQRRPKGLFALKGRAAE